VARKLIVNKVAEGPCSLCWVDKSGEKGYTAGVVCLVMMALDMRGEATQIL